MCSEYISKVGIAGDFQYIKYTIYYILYLQYIFKVGIAGDFVANGNLFFPAQNKFLCRLMVRAEQRCAILQNQNSMKQIQSRYTGSELTETIAGTLVSITIAGTLGKAGTPWAQLC